MCQFLLMVVVNDLPISEKGGIIGKIFVSVFSIS